MARHAGVATCCFVASAAAVASCHYDFDGAFAGRLEAADAQTTKDAGPALDASIDGFISDAPAADSAKDAAFEASADAPAEASLSCGAKQKVCDGRCVDQDDPNWGCGDTGCAPCELPHATAACASGECVIESCLDTFRDCDAIASSGCETDTRSDSKHCGKCHRDCLTSSCAQGFCAPQEIASVASVVPGAVVVDADRAYFAAGDGTNTGLWVVGKDGAGLDNIVTVTGQPYLAVDDTNLYFTESTNVRKWIKQSDQTAVLRSVGTPTSLASGGGYVFVSAVPSSGHKIVRLSSNGAFRTLSSREDTPVGVTLLGDVVYWANQSEGVIRSVPMAGGEATDVAQTSGEPTDVAVTADHFFWSDKAGTIQWDGQPQVIATAEAVGSLELSPSHDSLHWVDSATGQIGKVSTAGGSASVLVAAASCCAGGVAVDEHWVYWTASQGTDHIGLYRVAR